MAGKDYMPSGEMPRIIERQRQRPPPPPWNPMPEEHPRSGPDAMYAYLWPTVFWAIALYCIAMMIGTLYKFFFTYDPWAHAQVAGITVVLIGLMAIVYKKVLEPPREIEYVIEPHTYDQVPVPSPNNGERAA